VTSLLVKHAQWSDPLDPPQYDFVRTHILLVCLLIVVFIHAWVCLLMVVFIHGWVCLLMVVFIHGWVCLLMVLFIHGWVCLPCVNLDGTLYSMMFCIAVLNACHIDSTFLSLFLCVVFKIAKSSFILYMSAFFPQ
jgi:hypothetical protein